MTRMGGPEHHLVYLDQRMLAEPIRLALTIGGVDFEDERIGYDEVNARRQRGELPFGQVPVLVTKDGAVLSQTSAILRWAGQQAGLEESPFCDAVEAALGDVRVVMRPQWYGHVLGRSPVDGTFLVPLSQAQADDVVKLLADVVVPTHLKRLEAKVVGPYFCGASLAICDLSWYNMCIGLLEEWYCPGLPKTVLDACPRLIQLASRIHHLPAVRAWNEANGYGTPPALATYDDTAM
eukprot:CAMPEP_0197424310 /NCGR_PEP_ID=MMETSP1170-20131217/25567_1 /TAXON_ID=54406 /ORGANISM="Sarcinochrysis sp, Strain CCMP770" /LENGTH=235 /DNA_ID=CAMNT_0042951789 /DNA_START=7 /DNA_END=714 /DNA_ORIENTATION=+